MAEFIVKTDGDGWGTKAGELIRCKDCKYLQTEDMGMYATCGRSYLGMVRPSDYCSRAERKTDTTDDTVPTGFMSEWAREIDEQLDGLNIRKTEGKS